MNQYESKCVIHFIRCFFSIFLMHEVLRPFVNLFIFDMNGTKLIEQLIWEYSYFYENLRSYGEAEKFSNSNLGLWIEREIYKIKI
jgi:hypothetical protein